VPAVLLHPALLQSGLIQLRHVVLQLVELEPSNVLPGGLAATTVATAATAVAAATKPVPAAAQATAAGPLERGRRLLGRMRRSAGCLPRLLRPAGSVLPPGLGGRARCVRWRLAGWPVGPCLRSDGGLHFAAAASLAAAAIAAGSLATTIATAAAARLASAVAAALAVATTAIALATAAAATASKPRTSRRYLHTERFWIAHPLGLRLRHHHGGPRANRLGASCFPPVVHRRLDHQRCRGQRRCDVPRVLPERLGRHERGDHDQLCEYRHRDQLGARGLPVLGIVRAHLDVGDDCRPGTDDVGRCAGSLSAAGARRQQREPGVLGRMQRTAGYLHRLLRRGWRLLPPGLGGLARLVRWRRAWLSQQSLLRCGGLDQPTATLAAASFASTTALAPGSVATAVAIAAASLAAGSLATAVAIAAAALPARSSFAATTIAATATAAVAATAVATATTTTAAPIHGYREQPQPGVLGWMQRTAGCLPWLLRSGRRLLPPGLGGLARCVR
jgi:hypothetical protein